MGYRVECRDYLAQSVRRGHYRCAGLSRVASFRL